MTYSASGSTSFSLNILKIISMAISVIFNSDALLDRRSDRSPISAIFSVERERERQRGLIPHSLISKRRISMITLRFLEVDEIMGAESWRSVISLDTLLSILSFTPSLSILPIQAVNGRPAVCYVILLHFPSTVSEVSSALSQLN